MEAGSNTSPTDSPLRHKGDGKETQCLWVELDHSFPGKYKYRELALQVWGLLNL
jgi:hypothetical protein